MKSKKATKRALLTSAMSLVLCFAMLLGSTYAWFTDEAKTGVNTIQSGTLDVALVAEDGRTSLEGQSLKFVKADTGASDNVLWEPGATYYTQGFQIQNHGNLWLKFEIVINGVSDGNAKLLEAIDFVISTDKEGKNGISLDNNGKMYELAPDSTFNNATYYLVGHMDEDAGNEYQDLKIEGVGITVFATQKDAEYDSFDNDYDADAAYGTLVTTDEELLAAIQDPSILAIRVDGDLTYNWGGDSYANSKALLMSGKTFFGADADASITFAGYGSANPITNVTLKNITVKDETVGDNENAWEHGYLEFVSLKAENVVFADSIMLSGNSVLANCSVNNTVASWYGVWVEGGNTTITDSTFTGTRAIKIHEANGSEVSSVAIDNCIFDLSEKPGVAIGTVDADTSVSITNSIFDCQPGDQGLYIYETDTDVATFAFVESGNTTGAIKVPAPGVIETATKTYEVASAQGLANLNDVLETIYSGEGQGATINLKADIDLAGQAWEPINKMWVTFNGNGHTIKNMTVEGTRKAGLFGYAGAVIINDLTIENANVTGSQVGIFAGAGEGLKVNNCYLKGTNTVTFVATEETWNGIGAITGVLTTSNVNVTITEGTTVTLNKTGFTTDSGCTYVDDMTGYIQANNGTVTNNGTVVVKAKVAGTAESVNNILDSDGDLAAEVVLTDDLTVGTADTDSKSGYGATGITVNGGTLDGDGNTLTVNNANGTWDSAINAESGTIKNLTVTGAFRGIFMGGATGDVYIDNVVIDGTCYTFNSDAGNKAYGVYISDSTLNGWTSYSDVHKEVVFTNCKFGAGTGGYNYAFCRPYNASVFKNCVFEIGFKFDTSKTSDIVFDNCYYGDTLITAENAASLAVGEGDDAVVFFYNGLNNITIK